MSPLVSVLIPTYNYADYLTGAIESVLSQTFRDFELLVVDDASRDDTVCVLERYAKRDSRIRLEVNPRNLGLVGNWNRCLAMARGEYVKFLFADDLLLERDAIATMVERMRSDPTVSLVASARRVLREDSAAFDVWGHWTDGEVLDGPSVVRRCMIDMINCVGEPSAVLFRRTQAKRGFDTRYIQIVDLEMWFYLLGLGRFSYIGRPLCAFRQHARQQTEKAKRQQLHVLDWQLLIRDYAGEPSLHFSAIERWYMETRNIHMLRRRARRIGAASRQPGEPRGLLHRWHYFFVYPAYRIYREYVKWTIRRRNRR